MNRDTYCSYCSTRFDAQSYPRTCRACGNTTYLNAPAVGVGIIPINQGLLIIRRGIRPGYGQLALPSGFKNIDETWEAGIAREVQEETGIQVDPVAITMASVKTASNGTVLVFGICDRLVLPEPVQFTLDHETLEAMILDHPEPMAFLHHTTMVEWYWNSIGRSPSESIQNY